MKILHTADWHLGQRLMNRHRKEEHELVLAWLLETVIAEKIEVLIIAGDVFDTPNPPNYAEQLYFDFLKKITRTKCRHIIIIGGNHDAPSKLNAPKELLKIFNIHVLGAITGVVQDQIVELKNDKGDLEGIIALVPFLRDRDLLYAEEQEGSKNHSERLKQAIASHFDAVAAEVNTYDPHLPKIVVGHLFATGASTSGKQDNIYVGNIENIDGSQFSEIFDYVALGHIHRAQSIGGQPHIRYSGSLIPVSFSEVANEKSVTIVNFEAGRFLNQEKRKIPSMRPMFQVSGKYDDIIATLQKKLSQHEAQLTPWVEIEMEKVDLHALVDSELRRYVSELGGEVLRVKVRQGEKRDINSPKMSLSLQDIDDMDVFERRCKQWGLDEGLMAEVKDDYKLLKEWMEEQ